MAAEERLKELGIELPLPTRPVANYVSTVKTGNLLFLSGHGPHYDGKTRISGKLGRELSTEEGYQTGLSS